ncbi:hypothetical protein [Pseudomonas sp. Colony2]|uniref:hypothetical protein n=1 Tax=Pseudomonas sp. Colony2 TaxID=2861799 RepID=UPI001C5F53A0|nr:hypothetical protein [Pseudomonas sp. Colony2]
MATFIFESRLIMISPLRMHRTGLDNIPGHMLQTAVSDGMMGYESKGWVKVVAYLLPGMGVEVNTAVRQLFAYKNTPLYEQIDDRRRPRYRGTGQR